MWVWDLTLDLIFPTYTLQDGAGAPSGETVQGCSRGHSIAQLHHPHDTSMLHLNPELHAC